MPAGKAKRRKKEEKKMMKREENRTGDLLYRKLEIEKAASSSSLATLEEALNNSESILNFFSCLSFLA